MKQELFYKVGDLPARIFIEPKLWNILAYVTKEYSKEFTALTHVDHNPEMGTYYMYDAFFPKQKNSMSQTEFDGIDVMKLERDGADLKKLSGHYHSHVNMGVSPSTTDDDEIIERVVQGGDFSCSLIGNKKGKVFAHIADGARDRYFSEVPVEIYVSDKEKEEIEGEFLEVVRKCNTFSGVQSLTSTFSLEEEILKKYALTKDEEKKLDDIMKDRFTSAYLGYQGKKRRYKNKNHIGYHKKKKGNDVDEKYYEKMAEAWEKKGNLDDFQDALDIEEATEEENKRFQELCELKINEMSDAEFTEYQKLCNKVQIF